MKKDIEAVFIDRDGTLGGDGHFKHPKDFKLYSFTYEALKILKNNDIRMYAFTNQHRISRGEATIEEFEEEFKSYGFDKAYICPHPMDGNCLCRKPQPGMLLKAASEHNLNLNKCWIIGDTGTDMMAAFEIGASKILVKTGWGESSLGKYRDIWKDINPEYIAADLLDAIKWLLSE